MRPIPVVLLIAAIPFAAAACGDTAADRAAAIQRVVELSKNVKALGVKDVKVGTGAEAVPGRTLRVHYTGRLLDGTKFDSSHDSGEPIEFTLGAGEVIEGWEEGIRGMRVGGERELTIPSAMAYGVRGRPPLIPSNAALQFDIELVGVE
jgi:FKBP-type peptidyl-prolyl cis-trans isomerase